MNNELEENLNAGVQQDGYQGDNVKKQGFFARCKNKLENTKAYKLVSQKISDAKKNKKLHNTFESDDTVLLDIVFKNDKRIKKILFKFNDEKCELYCKDQYNLSNLLYIENPKSGTKYYDVRIVNDKIKFHYNIEDESMEISCFVYKYKLDKPVENKSTIYNIGELNQTSIGKNAIVGDGNTKKTENTLSVGLHLPKND